MATSMACDSVDKDTKPPIAALKGAPCSRELQPLKSANAITTGGQAVVIRRSFLGGRCCAPLLQESLSASEPTRHPSKRHHCDTQ